MAITYRKDGQARVPDLFFGHRDARVDMCMKQENMEEIWTGISWYGCSVFV